MDEYYLIPLHHTVAGGQHVVGVRVGGAVPVLDGQKK